MPTMNRQWHLVSRPAAEAMASNFALVEAPLPALADGQVLVRHHYLSLDPYMRGRMNDAKNYAKPQPLNAVMQGGTVGEVIESRHPGYQPGDKVVGMGGWQEYAVVDAGVPGSMRKVDTTHVPLPAYLGAVGMPGVTAWYGLMKIIEPKAGQTIAVSAASGAVGPRSRRRDSAWSRWLTEAISSVSRAFCPICCRRRSSVSSRIGTVASADRERLMIGSTMNRYPPISRATTAPAPTTMRSRGLSVGTSAILRGLARPGRVARRALPRRPDAELLLVLRLRHRRGELHPLEAVGGFE